MISSRRDNKALHNAARKGHTDVVISLITDLRNSDREMLEDYISETDKHGNTALEVAARNGHLDIVEYLLETIYLLDDNNNDDYDEDDNESEESNEDENNATLLPFAASYGNQDVVVSMVQKHIQDFINLNNITTAAGRNKNATVTIIQRKIRDYINSKDNDGSTALHYASMECNIGTMKYLLSNGADYNAKDLENRTPLHYAAIRGHIDAVNCLVTHVLNKNPDDLQNFISEKDNKGHTALLRAIVNGYVDVLNYLLDNDAEYVTKDNRNLTPLHYAVMSGNYVVVVNLITHARINKNPDILRRFINEEDDNGNTVFNYAVAKGYKDIHTYLLGNGAEYMTKNKNNQTPLHYAVMNGDKDIVISLITHVQNNSSNLLQHYINKMDSRGYAALHCAVAKGFSDILAYLLKNGAEYVNKTKNRQTLLHFAVMMCYGNKDVVVPIIKHVRKNNSDLFQNYINEKDDSGNTALLSAAALGYHDVLKYLLRNGAKYNTRNNNNSTPLHCAVLSGDKDMVITLMAHVRVNDPDILQHYINLQDDKGRTALDYANQDIVTDLLEYYYNNITLS